MNLQVHINNIFFLLKTVSNIFIEKNHVLVNFNVPNSNQNKLYI